MMVALMLLLALMAPPQVNLSGKWDGSITGQRNDGTEAKEPVLLILEHKDKSLTGTVGRDESDRHPVTSGTIEGNRVVLQAKNARNARPTESRRS